MSGPGFSSSPGIYSSIHQFIHTFINLLGELKVVKGSTVNIKCRAQGSPAPQVYIHPFIHSSIIHTFINLLGEIKVVKGSTVNIKCSPAPQVYIHPFIHTYSPTRRNKGGHRVNGLHQVSRVSGISHSFIHKFIHSVLYSLLDNVKAFTHLSNG